MLQERMIIEISNKIKLKINYGSKNTLKNNILILFFTLFLAGFMNGQSAPDFSILTDKAFQKLYQNPDECITYSQSFLISDKNIEHKIVLQNIVSQAYAMQGNYMQSVNISNQKDDSQQEGLSRFVQFFGEYNLADQYQNLGLYNQSQRIISGILADHELLDTTDPKMRITLAKLYQLQAINSGIIRNYNAALKSLDSSDQYLDRHNEQNKIIRWENRIFRSSYLIKQNKLEEAKKMLESTIHDIDNHGNNPFLSAYAYETLSRYFFLKEDYNASIKNLEKSLSYIERLPYNNVRIIIYELMSKSYLALNNDEKHHYYNKLYTDLKTKHDASKKEGIQYIVKLVDTYQNKNLEFQKQNKLRQLNVFIIIVLLLVVGIVSYFLTEVRRNKDLKKQFGFFEKQKQSEQPIPIETLKEKGTKENKTAEKDSSKISKAKEDEILQKLKEWEKSDNFLNKNMSISVLSAETGINTKYLSEVINSNMGKNFNGYINELRINHVARLLKTNPSYLNYKVSYLAEYAGFSSHGAFTNVFKSLTGMSPNTYIQEITKNKKS